MLAQDFNAAHFNAALKSSKRGSPARLADIRRDSQSCIEPDL